MAKAQRRRDPNEGSGRGNGPRMAGEYRTGPVAGTAIVSGVTFASKALQYAEVDGMAMFEGDIVLGTIEEVRAATERTAAAFAQAGTADAGQVVQSIGVTGAQFRWPNARIPFEIAAGFPNPQRVTNAIAHWQANTRIRFVERTPANASQFPDFVRFVNGGGCSSQVGRRGGMQQITLGPNCTTGNAIHEIGHTVGLWHEQSREDRDTFVRIQWANIDPAMQHNFDQHVADGDDLGPYDYGSIMHYPPNAFSVNGQPTIVPLQPLGPGVVMGQRNGLSAGDIAGVHMMYPAGPTTIKEIRKDPIADPTIKEIRKDPIADPTIKEIRKDPISDPTIKEIRKDPIADPTIKELVRDPIGPGGTWVEVLREAPGALGGGAAYGGATPFVMAGPSQFGSEPGAGGEQAALIQAFGEALASIQEQLAQLTALYDALTQGGEGGIGAGG